MHKLGSLWFSHKRSSVEELEEIAEQLNPDIFAEDPRVSGVAVINTCNRAEVYISSANPNEILEEVVNRLKLEKGEISIGEDALEHLMRVACGLEAMMVGEDQILGQVKDCYLESKKEGMIDSLLDMAFERAIKVAKRARNETEINEGAVSIGSAAVELAEDITGGLEEKSVLVIGAGEMGTLVAKALSKKDLKAMFIANRGYERAKRLAEKVGGNASKLREKDKWLSVCDITISTTSAPHYILSYDLMKKIMEHRKNNNLLIIDIASPKDVEERVGEIEDVELYDLDDLRKISEENLRKRLSEVSKVERIIREEIKLFRDVLGRQRAERLIAMIYKYGHRTKEEEKKRALSYIEKGRDPKEVLEDLSRAVSSKTLHTPTKILRKYVERKGKNDSDFIDFFMDELEKELRK